MRTFIARKSVIIGVFFFLLCLVSGGQAYAADGNVTITAGTGGAVTRSPAGTLVSGTKYSWANNTNVTFTITPDPGYLVADVLWNTVSAGAVTTLTKNIRNNNVFTLVANFNKKPSNSASYSSTPAGAPNGTLQSSLGTESPAGVWTVNPNTTPTFTINTPANWLLNTIRVDNAVTGTLITAAANSLACNTTSSTPQTCTFNYAVGTTDHIFHVALKPFDNPATVNAPQLAVTTSTVSVINTPCITDPDNTQNVIYSLYADAAGTTLLSSNGIGSFSGLSSNTDYWVRVSGQTYNRISSAWENQASPLVKTTTSAQNYTVDLSIALGSGTVMVNGAAVTPPETTGLASGQSITYIFIPASSPDEYVLSDVKVTDSATGVVTSYGPVSPFTITNVTANKSVAVYFKRVWTIAVNPGANGAISPANPAKVIDGNDQAFTLLPATGYEVAQLLVDGVDQGAITSYTFTNVTADHTIAAVFAASGTGLGMSAYSITPPFIASRVKPNLLLMLDNSSSMYDLAYTTPATYCLDHSYTAAQSYEGYFDQAEIYNYDLVNGKFTAGSAIPASCNYRTAYMCINASGAWPNMAVTEFKASGRFLNWLTASKFDVQKKVLTGGKFNTTYNVLEGESRGCVGRRFIKTIPAVANLTFGVRGPNAYDPDFISQSTQGGGTRIEIYVGTGATYNEAACTAAAAAWVDPGSIGTVQNITKACIGTGASALKGDAYNHAIHNCFWALTGDHKLSNMNTMQGDCASIYDIAEYNNDPSKITKENGADAICSSVLTHPDYGNGGGNTTGFLGKCATKSVAANGNVSWSWDDTCSDTEIRDYCGGTHEFDVIDPSNAAAIEVNTPVAVPSFIMDAGVNALGNVALTALVRIALAKQPTGLIQDFQSYITFGAMKFNQNGSGSECNDGVSNTTSNIKCAKSCSITTAKQCYVTSDCPAGESCGISTRTDGGKIISYSSYDPVGDHTFGLVKDIDDIQATSWTPWAEAYYNSIGYFANRADMRLQSTDFDETKNPSALSCRFNNTLIISDGGSTGDQHSSVAALASRYNDGDGQTGACGGFSGSKDLDDLAWLAKNRNIKTFSKSATSTDAPTKNNEYVTTYTVFTGATDATVGECNPQTLMNQTAVNGGTVPYVADGGAAFRDAIFGAFTKVAAQSSSGTAASILNNSEGSGAILLQAIFYPSKTYENNTGLTWSGELINLWYFVDPFFTLSTIREDTDYTSGTHVMDISKDKRVQFFFDTTSNQTMVKRYNFDGTTALADLNSDITGGLKTLWTAGKKLWKRNLATDPRTIYTTIDSQNFTDFSLADAATLSFRLDAEGADAAEKTAFAGKVISYVHGFDVCLDSSSPCTNKSRNRTVTITVDDNGTPVKTDDTNETHVWKLGDIISSTPKLQAGQPLQSYDQAPPLGYSDSTYKQFYSGANYKNRGMVYVGGNDGMLHAIKMGKIDIKTIGNQKATLTGANLGREEWSFIPKHVMPYLKYLTLPDYDTNHLYLVDGANLLFDVATGVTAARDDYWNETRTATTWKTVLLGGMGLGGASKNTVTACTANIETGTCVKAPFALHGFSSYFAIDVTNQDFNQDANNLLRAQPTLLWEFAHPELGYSTSGPALVRLHSKTTDAPFPPQKDKNGRWFAVFASGPTGPIDTSNKQFKGKSDQNLKLFVVDIEKGPVVSADPKQNGLWIIDTGITEAFAGSISNNSVVDAETIQTFPLSANARQDDVVYVGYTKKAGDGTWTDGGVLRLVIPDTANPDVMDMSEWKTSKLVTGIGPVTTAVSKLMSKNNLYLFFGTGRFYYPADDMGSTRRIFMVKDKCYPVRDGSNNFVRSDLVDNCTEATVAPLQLSDLTARNTTSNDAVDNGWYIDLDPGERVVTDTVSTTSGTIFYTSFKPTTDPCGLGGKSYLWGVRYDTGGTIPAGSKNGKVLIQLSTGSFAELDLKSALTEKDGRRTAETSELSFGKASADAGLFMTSAGLAPVKRVLHIQERIK